MSGDDRALVVRFRESLTQQRYSPVVVHNYCHNAENFLSYLKGRKITFEPVTSGTISIYLGFAVRQFRKRNSRAPAAGWESIPGAGIHAILKFALGCWPPEPVTSEPRELLRQEVCSEYQKWLEEERGLALPSIHALMWEARHFCAWYTARSSKTKTDCLLTKESGAKAG